MDLRGRAKVTEKDELRANYETERRQESSDLLHRPATVQSALWKIASPILKDNSDLCVQVV